MTAGGGDLERPLGAFLALDVEEIEPGDGRGDKPRLGRRQQLGPLEMVDDREQARRRDDLDLTGPGRLAAAARPPSEMRRPLSWLAAKKAG